MISYGSVLAHSLTLVEFSIASVVEHLHRFNSSEEGFTIIELSLITL